MCCRSERLCQLRMNTHKKFYCIEWELYICYAVQYHCIVEEMHNYKLLKENILQVFASETNLKRRRAKMKHVFGYMNESSNSSILIQSWSINSHPWDQLLIMIYDTKTHFLNYIHSENTQAKQSSPRNALCNMYEIYHHTKEQRITHRKTCVAEWGKSDCISVVIRK